MRYPILTALFLFALAVPAHACGGVTGALYSPGYSYGCAAPAAVLAAPPVYAPPAVFQAPAYAPPVFAPAYAPAVGYAPAFAGYGGYAVRQRAFGYGASFGVGASYGHAGFNTSRSFGFRSRGFQAGFAPGVVVQQRGISRQRAFFSAVPVAPAVQVDVRRGLFGGTRVRVRGVR